MLNDLKDSKNERQYRHALPQTCTWGHVTTGLSQSTEDIIPNMILSLFIRKLKV